MGNLFGSDAGDDEEEEAKALDSWRPQTESAQMANLKKRRDKDRGSSESSQDESGASDSHDGGSTASQDDSIAGDSIDGESEKDAASSKGSEKESEAESEDDGEEGKQADMMQKQRDAKRKKKIVVRMDFEPLLALHEPLAAIVEEPADLFAHRKQKKGGRGARAELAAIEDTQHANRRKAKITAEWLIDMGLDDCILKELAQAIGEDPDELKYALIQSMRFTVDEEGVVRRTMLQKIFDVMESDIETFREVLEKLVLELQEDENDVETNMREAIRTSLGELRLKLAQDTELVEHVDLEAEAEEARLEEKDARQKEKEMKARKAGKSADDDSSSEEDADFSMNKEAEKRALAFRRVQVQKKIEDFLRLYTKGQNLTKISKGKKYHRRVYIDTVKRSLVIQGATGPKLYPFAKMRDVDMDVRTTPEGRVENLVVCAIENNGRITKELTLCFPDHAKANQFVNCVTLFAAALRPHRKS